MRKLILLLAAVASLAWGQYQTVPSTNYPALEAVLNGKVTATKFTGPPTGTCTPALDHALNMLTGGYSYCDNQGIWRLIPLQVLVPSNNLSDLTNITVARANLGLGTMATTNNPMSVQGDFIVGGASGVPARLAVPADGTWCPHWVSGVVTLVSCPGSSGGIGSITMAVPSFMSASPVPFVASGTLTLSMAGGQTSHQVIGTCGTATTFAPCPLLASDIPVLNQSTTGNAANVTGVVSEANGGTGAANSPTTAGHYLRYNGVHYVDSAIQTGDVPTLNQSTTGNAANVTGIVSPANGGTGAANTPGAAGHVPRSNGTGTYLDSAIQVADVPTLNQNTTGTAGGLTGTPALPNGTTATTQAQADNSTKLATTSYVDTGLTTKLNATNPTLGSSAITETWTVGAGGVTANTLVQTDSSAPLKIVAATTGVYGIAMSTVSSAGSVEIARYGTVSCVTDSTGATAGDLVVIGTGTVIRCRDSGQTASSAISISSRVVGIFRSAAAAGSTALVELTPAHFGTLLSGSAQPATPHVVVFSATPTFTCASSTAGTIDSFSLSTALSANITSSTLSGCTPGQQLNFVFQQTASGGPFSVAMPTGFSQACPVSPLVNTKTKMSYVWDGTNAQLIVCSLDTGPSVGVTQAAPGTNPPSGELFHWDDSTDNVGEDKDSTGNVYAKVKKGGALDPVANTLAAAYRIRVCDLPVGDTSGSALVNAQLGPQSRMCFIPAAAVIVELDVNADAGTPNVIIGRNHAGTITNIVSAALATAASGGIACSTTGGGTGINGATCSSTLQNTSLAAGDYLELVSGTAGGTAKFFVAHVVYAVN